MSLPALEATTTQALSLALDAASLRHKVIATNIAHANTPGYRAQRVSFQALVTAGLDGPRAELRADATPLPAGERPDVVLDMEMAALAQNTVHQQAMLRGLQRHLGLLATVVTEGKR